MRTAKEPTSRLSSRSRIGREARKPKEKCPSSSTTRVEAEYPPKPDVCSGWRNPTRLKRREAAVKAAASPAIFSLGWADVRVVAPTDYGAYKNS